MKPHPRVQSFVTHIGARAVALFMQYKAVSEHDLETNSYTATVLGFPVLFVDAEAEEEALGLARDAIEVCHDEIRPRSHSGILGGQ